jgi:hypothetical protein
MPFVKSNIYFQGNGIIPILQRQVEQMRELVASAGTELLSTPRQPYIESLAERFKLQIPVLHMADATKDVSEERTSRRGKPARVILAISGSATEVATNERINDGCRN